jgi:hypothetical protein
MGMSFIKIHLVNVGACGDADGPKHCITSQKVVGSFPDRVIEILHGYNPPGRTVALGWTQPLTEMSARDISWGVKTAGA